MSWSPVDKNALAEHDADYRVTFQVYSPYSVTSINRVIRLLRLGEGAAGYLYAAMNQTLTIKGIEAVPEIGHSQVPMTSDKPEAWHLVVTFTKTANGTPLLIVIGTILVLLAVVIGITGWTVEKFNQGPAGETLSLGVLVAAAAAFLFIWKGRAVA